MNLLILLGALFFAPAPAPVDGYRYPLAVGNAWQYRPGVIEGVARYRGLHWQSNIIGFASDLSCARVGQRVYARVGSEIGWWLIVDCSNPRDLHAQRALKHEVLEVGYVTAHRQGWDYYTLGGPGHVKAAIYGYARR